MVKFVIQRSRNKDKRSSVALYRLIVQIFCRSLQVLFLRFIFIYSLVFFFNSSFVLSFLTKENFKSNPVLFPSIIFKFINFTVLLFFHNENHLSLFLHFITRIIASLYNSPSLLLLWSALRQFVLRGEYRGNRDRVQGTKSVQSRASRRSQRILLFLDSLHARLPLSRITNRRQVCGAVAIIKHVKIIFLARGTWKRFIRKKSIYSAKINTVESMIIK